jgi:hypothetical protein
MSRRDRGRGPRRGRDESWEDEPRQRPRDRQRDWQRERRRERVRDARPTPVPAVVAPREPPPVARVCGNCREWFGEELVGRGECAHPGSGFLRPWADTQACPFFEARR